MTTLDRWTVTELEQEAARNRLGRHLAPILGDREYDGRTVFAELISNAFLHGLPPVEVSVRHYPDVAVIIEVHDGGTDTIEAGASGLFDESGRGMVMVAGLSDSHGLLRDADGVRAWAEFSLRRQPPGTRPDGGPAVTFTFTSADSA